MRPAGRRFSTPKIDYNKVLISVVSELSNCFPAVCYSNCLVLRISL